MKKILIADDDKVSAEKLRDILESKGYQAFCAYEGLRVVEIAHKEHPDIIILDWKMPAGRGGEVMKFLSEKDDTRKIPIIVLSEGDEQSIDEKSTLFGAKDIIYKPFETDLLINKIEEIIA